MALKRLGELVRDKDGEGLRGFLHELLPEASLSSFSGDSQPAKRRLVLVAGRGK